MSYEITGRVRSIDGPREIATRDGRTFLTASVVLDCSTETAAGVVRENIVEIAFGGTLAGIPSQAGLRPGDVAVARFAVQGRTWRGQDGRERHAVRLAGLGLAAAVRRGEQMYPEDGYRTGDAPGAWRYPVQGGNPEWEQQRVRNAVRSARQDLTGEKPF